ncbi:cytochrome P450 [Coniochaeta ligniaria NRRL 30616]|uniref:Cytochrome P450 n=1 Tax=Coniochaeta ligniaria NRRL 30616 TaxID=1408157 RepID=A0A1J7I4G4_9PEZI|nr:cytochrome P450 [Coniochaeta ligniaria NRRL 30616]
MLTLALLVAAPTLLVAYLLQQAHYRRFRQYAVLPQLKPSLVWGHMKALHEISLRGRPGQHFDDTALDIYESLGRPPVFVVDLRPVSYAILVVANHEVAEQISRVSPLFPWSVTKSPTNHANDQLVGKDSMNVKEGEDWKALRKRFSLGFAHQHLMTLLPLIMDKTWQFMKHLDSYARTGEDFPLGVLLTNLTFDIIGVVSLDVDFGAQLDKAHQSEFIQVYQQLVAAFEGQDNPFPDPKGRFRRWRLSGKMDKLLTEMVKQKLSEYQRLDSKNKARSIVALASNDSEPTTPDTLGMIVDQVKSFIFAGHDTTSILLQWAFYELYRNPGVLNAIRSELDGIFGPDPDPAVVRDKLLSGEDDTMARLVYTSAVIKETLRLYPPAGTARYSKPGTGFKLHMPGDNRDVDVDGLVLYNCQNIIQRDPAVYGETADDFVPERWLGNTDTSMKTNDDLAPGEKSGSKVPGSAWRPFERGPRNCIGQELANIEARVILACAVRRYDFTKVGLGELDLDANGHPKLNAKGVYEVKSKLYNTRQVTARPIDKMMMRVQLNPNASFDI